MYPPNDDQHETLTIASVSPRAADGSRTIQRSDGFSFYVPPSEVPIEPGMSARFYGRGLGFTVRGLFINELKVFYRTEDEDKDHQEIESYGADAADWLARWDAGRSVWTIEMGGLGPGYEQCIHITCAEILRHMLKAKYDGISWADADAWKRDRALIERALRDNEVVHKLGLSGAQFGAAMSIAVQLYRRGPRDVMADPEVKDRHIQVSKNFPGA